MFDDLFKDYIELKAESLSTSCFLGDGKGGFERKELPKSLQLAPVFAFVPIDRTSSNSFIGAGNFYGVLPYEGRYDALLPTVFSFNKNAGDFTSSAKLDGIKGEIKNAKWIKYADGSKLLLIVRNDEALLFYK
jgi:hypothetical protein